MKTLEVKIDISINKEAQIPRLAQLTQKTNQFNLSTKRSTEQDLKTLIKNGAMIFSGDVSDKFGSYGITILAIVEITNKTEAVMTTFLMSCRVMGRRIEEVFFTSVVSDLKKRGFDNLRVSFIPSKKNMPAKNFLPDIIGAKIEKKKKSGEILYKISIPQYILKSKRNTIPIKTNFI